MERRNDRHFVLRLRLRVRARTLPLSPQKHYSSVSGQSGAFPAETPGIFTEVAKYSSIGFENYQQNVRLRFMSYANSRYGVSLS